MMDADRFIPHCPPSTSPSALKCAQVSGSSSEVTLFIYAKLAHLWNGAFKASDIKDSKAGPIKSEQGQALRYSKLKQLCESWGNMMARFLLQKLGCCFDLWLDAQHMVLAWKPVIPFWLKHEVFMESLWVNKIWSWLSNNLNISHQLLSEMDCYAEFSMCFSF